MIPLRAHGVEVMSIGFMIDAEQPMAWRGPMVTQALTQLLGDTHWGELDYLVVDMPPGTGDIQLTLAQRVPVSGAVIVTTPQDIALLDARKGLKMFEKVEVRVLGVVENMSVHVCSACGHIRARVRQRRRGPHGGAVRRAALGRTAPGYSHSRGCGRRGADGGGRTRQRAGPGLFSRWRAARLRGSRP
jgi:Mrp family chromosome partitioning ATPase